MAGRGNHVTTRIDGKEELERANAKLRNQRLKAGDALILRTGGGGGFGSPLERDAQIVANDVRRRLAAVRAQVLEVDTEKRRLRLGMKQLVPTSIDEYLAERNEGDVVTGRIIDVSGEVARVELGEGIHASCTLTKPASGKAAPASGKPDTSKADLSSLSSMLQERWKGGAGEPSAKSDEIRAGQVRSFRITKLDRAAKKIAVELALG